MQACGWLRWTPETFWNATLDEVSAAVYGYAESRGALPKADEEAEKWERLYRLGREAMIAEQKGGEDVRYH